MQLAADIGTKEKMQRGFREAHWWGVEGWEEANGRHLWVWIKSKTETHSSATLVGAGQLTAHTQRTATVRRT